MACVCHSLAACQRHTSSSLAAVIGLCNNDVTSLRSLRCVRCVGWKRRFIIDGDVVLATERQVWAVRNTHPVTARGAVRATSRDTAITTVG